MTSSDVPAPRLCHIFKWPDFEGYGFNLHSDKTRGGQFIGSVDEGSPAEAAGLKAGDKIIEVNGVDVTRENHRQVVQKIKQKSNETKLLVVDEETEEYYESREIPITSKLTNIKYSKTPSRNSQSSNDSSDSEPEPPKPTTPKQSAANGTAQSKSQVTEVPSSATAPAPRLCHVVKWKENQSYGFHLHSDNAKLEHYIGKIDPGTPAASAGLKVKDRLVEVNGFSVSKKPLGQVVQKIKGNPNETTLLVIDPVADAYYQKRNIVVSSKMNNIVRLQTSTPLTESAPAPVPARASDPVPIPTPAPRQTGLTPVLNLAMHEGESRDDEEYVELRNRKPPTESSPPVQKSNEPTYQPVQVESTRGNAYSSPVKSSPLPSRPYSGTSRPLSTLSVATLSAAAATGLDISMTAAELRARLASRKKVDPRRQTIDLRQKYKIIQTM